MRPLVLDEILDLESYDRARSAFRAAIIALKRERRLAVGDRVSLVFENRETLRFQVQEMLRAERICKPDRMQQELDVYNELMPGPRNLSATLFIEITDAADIRSELDRLIGIDEHVALVLGGAAEEEALPASFDPRQMEEDRISAVQYLRFPFEAEQAERFADTRVRARVRIDHPNYRAEAEIPDPMRRQLLEDLEGRAVALLY
ncbi:MAG: DUF3501 family protein [Myxococcota bacterium]